MKRMLMIIVVLSGTLSHANEITIELPGGIPLEMVWIEPGSYTMGAEEVWVTPREVTITEGFFLGKYEITQEQWQAVMGTAPWSDAPSHYQGPRHPAIGISWHDAQAFSRILNEHFGEESYRLPTQAEWEYACRAGTATRWSFGDDESLLESYGWYSDNAGNAGIQPVGEKLPNPWGLFDMHGNAEEWVHDWHGYDRHDGTPQTDPSGPVSGHNRLQRGGSYITEAIWTSSASSTYNNPVAGSAGFRLLKGEPLNLVIPERIPFPQDSTGPFFPVHEGNIWIMAHHRYGFGPPSVDTTAHVLESRIIEGQQYWYFGLVGGSLPFRVGEEGNIWIRPDSDLSETARFLQALEENPELRDSPYYQQSSFFQSLEPDQKELLLYDFEGGVVDFHSPDFWLDQQVNHLYFEGLGWVVWKTGEPAPDQRTFQISDPAMEWPFSQTFQRGVGIIKGRAEAIHNTSETDSDLLWARIDGKEYGLHPGPGYPGYRKIETVVASPELAAPHPVTSGLSPNFPNPFNSFTQIPYRLAAPGRVRLEIYNVLGQLVRTLVEEDQGAGSYRVSWDARDRQGASPLSSGVYIARLSYPGGVQTRRLLYLK